MSMKSERRKSGVGDHGFDGVAQICDLLFSPHLDILTGFFLRWSSLFRLEMLMRPPDDWGAY